VLVSPADWLIIAVQAQTVDGLVAYFPFDTGATDESGNGNQGVKYEGIQYKPGIIGNSISFDGVDDHIRIPSHSSLNPVDQLSVSFWVKVEGFVKSGQVYETFGGVSGAVIRLSDASGTFGSSVSDATGFYLFENVPEGEYQVQVLPPNGSGYVADTGQMAVSVVDQSITSVDFFLAKQMDITPPDIIPTVSGTQADNGWYRSDVTVSWSVVDNESPITVQSGCSSTTVTTDTTGVTFTCSATSSGGTA
jgi:hypothetical protein